MTDKEKHLEKLRAAEWGSESDREVLNRFFHGAHIGLIMKGHVIHATINGYIIPKQTFTAIEQGVGALPVITVKFCVTHNMNIDEVRSCHEINPETGMSDVRKSVEEDSGNLYDENGMRHAEQRSGMIQ